MIIRILRRLFFECIYPFMFHVYYRNNIWNIYSSYHKKNSLYKKFIWNKYMQKHSASISIDALIGSPLILPHGVSGIFISQSAIIGRDVVIFQQVTIGANTINGSKSYGAPIVSDNVYIGAGAKIIGSATLGKNARIGANAVVTSAVPDNCVVVLPAMRIIQKNTLDNTFNPFLDK